MPPLQQGGTTPSIAAMSLGTANMRIRGLGTYRGLFADWRGHPGQARDLSVTTRSEEHTSELQSLMRNSYAVFCLKKKKLSKNANTACNPALRSQLKYHHVLNETHIPPSTSEQDNGYQFTDLTYHLRTSATTVTTNADMLYT